MMKHRMERLVAFPFVTGCASSSSVAVCVQHARRSRDDIDSSHIVYRSFGMSEDHKDEEGALTSSDNMAKSSFRFTSLSKPSVSIRLQRLTKSIKSLSQSLGVFKEETDEVQMEMEIGLPTDVTHVAHVGFDGSVTSDANHHYGDLAASNFLGFCPISFARLEERLAMYMPLDASHDTDVTQARNKTDASMA